MSWDEICGERQLSAVNVDVRHPFDANASGGAFEIDDMTVFIFEDPSDGYRSSAVDPMIVKAPMYSFGCSPNYVRAPVLVRRWEQSEYGGSADGDRKSVV